jgi:circadian clock protein KaiC
LDDVLAGGFACGCVYLLEGDPGTGKTTIALQFLIAGTKAGDKGLYVTLSETEAELRSGAASHGWSLEGIEIFELVAPDASLDASLEQSLLYSSDLELGETIKRILEVIESTKPSRIVFDSLSEIRLLAHGSLRYRRQILALKQYFVRQGATVLLLDDLTAEAQDRTVHSIAHAVVRLEELAPEYGAERRRLRVTKYRGHRYRGGYHDITIETGGVVVFPRLVSSEHRRDFRREIMTSGIGELDELLGGGIESGSSLLLIGPSGAGKSLLALHFAVASIERGEQAVAFVFDEEIGLLTNRAKSVGIDLQALCDSGRLRLEQIDAAELPPGEFAIRVRDAVNAGARTIVIDSMNGYRAAMPEERFLLLHLHELLQYLNRQGASTFLTVAQHGLVGEMESPVDVTYLADTVVLLRYFEAAGRVRRAISVIKKRTGAHEDTIREFRIGSNGIRIGEPLTGVQGVLRGVPEFIGERGMLLSGAT